ncbi:MAG: SMP-30/gluconolactonase/LRE family protein [Variibacter sp.]|nr:SMP-30/gluconolactonase/LRE family protein [Variibacter sp.]
MSWTFERVAGPFKGPANGVVWDGQAVLFSLMEDLLIMRFDPQSKQATQIRNYTGRINGLAFGPHGEFYGCQEGGRRLVEMAPDGRMFKVDALLDGKLHNHPCDVTVDRAGRLWFSDPHSATLAFGPQIFPALDHASVLRLEKDERNAWALRRVTFDTVAPRAVLLSPDEKTLYVSDGEPVANHKRELRAYQVLADGSVGACRVLHTFGGDYRGPQRGVEGLCLSPEGNIVAVGGWRKSGNPFVLVFSPAGELIGAHAFPADLPNRCCFGGADRKTLFVTTGEGGLYAAQMR